ncbi:MAG: YtxH domain-containing protein [Natronincolaceae bacterium]|jgi:gas vesicle protein|nr:YtxH domain-containing protein [Bacillota bacterium]NLK91281.1 YtxH domain-containing protein [Clostridiales bacterium]
MNLRELQEKFNTIKRRMDPETIEREKRIERKKGMIRGFALGSVIAGITALLLSPDNGENNRKRAKEELEKVKDILKTNIARGGERIIQVYEDAREIIDDKKDMLTERLKTDDGMNVLEEDFEETEEDSDEVEYGETEDRH